MPEAAAPRRCPTCGKPAERAFRPFCSRRCADIDLHRWLTGAYVLPGAPPGEEADDGAPAPLPPAAGQD